MPDPLADSDPRTGADRGSPPIIALMPAGPEVPAPSLRYERKFLPDGLSLAEVLGVVRQHPALFREPYPERWVNNLYLDTPERRHYHDHVNGAANRLKIRIRWYGEPRRQAGGPSLEFKTRHGTLSGKTAHRLPALNLDGDFSRAVSTAALQSPDLPAAMRVRLHGLEPALMNRYRRRYFCSADGALRLTLDWALEFLPPRNGSSAPRPLLHHGSSVIVELKYSETHADTAAQATNEFPFRLTRCSKYVLGLEHSGAA